MSAGLLKLSYTVQEAAASTGLSRAYWDAEIRAGRIKAKTTKARTEDSARQGTRVILASELQRYLDEMEDAE